MLGREIPAPAVNSRGAGAGWVFEKHGVSLCGSERMSSGGSIDEEGVPFEFCWVFEWAHGLGLCSSEQVSSGPSIDGEGVLFEFRLAIISRITACSRARLSEVYAYVGDSFVVLPGRVAERFLERFNCNS